MAQGSAPLTQDPDLPALSAQDAAHPVVPVDILVVDDSRAQRRLLAMGLRKRGYRVVEAASGQEALTKLAARRFDLVLSDWMMPHMDGLTLCRLLRRRTTQDYTYIILLTAKQEKDEIARGLDAGADDFMVKPVTGVELDARIRAGVRAVQMHREVLRQKELASQALGKLRGLYDAIERDLRQARTLQESLLRSRDLRIGPARVCLTLVPCGHVGGDLVGLFQINARELGLYALDVSGHGLSAALMTARFAGLLSGATPGQNIALRMGADGGACPRDPLHVARDLNALLLDEIDSDHYATLFLASLDLQTGVLRGVQAGSPPALIQRAGGRIQTLGLGGMPVGLIDRATHAPIRARLKPGDRLVLVSDGLTEACSPKGRMLEIAGLRRLLSARKGADTALALNGLVDAARSFTGQDQFEDDVSALMLDYNGPKAR